jgi:hypothetical protein
MALRYLLDENLRGPLWSALERSNLRRIVPLEIACVGDEPDLPLASDDSQILRWAEERGFVIVSSDIRTIPGHFASHLESGHHSPGVFLVALPCSIPEIVEALFYYADASAADLWWDRIQFVP